jgi:plasmid maintenance system antidote protein VapI
MSLVDPETSAPYAAFVADNQDIIRAAILTAMKRSGMTKYELWQAVLPDVSKTTVYEFFKDKVSITTPVASRILKELGVTDFPLPKIQKKPKKKT